MEQLGPIPDVEAVRVVVLVAVLGELVVHSELHNLLIFKSDNALSVEE